jgi:hypothetical protein
VKNAITGIDGPLSLNLVEGSKTPVKNVKKVQELENKLASFLLTFLLAATRTISKPITVFMETIFVQSFSNQFTICQEFQGIIDDSNIAKMLE